MAWQVVLSDGNSCHRPPRLRLWNVWSSRYSPLWLEQRSKLWFDYQ